VVEGAEQAAGLGDVAVRRLIMLWPSVRVGWEVPDPEDFGDMGDGEVWREIWLSVGVDLVEVAGLMDSSIDLAREAFEKARAGRMIYPDGTVNRKVREVVAAMELRGRK